MKAWVQKYLANLFLVAKIALTITLLSISANASPITSGGEGNSPNSSVGSLTIKKYGQMPGTEKGVQTNPSLEQDPEGTPIEGVTFEVKQVESFNKDTNEWTGVTRGETYVVTTDESGSVTIPDIPLGRYDVKEVKSPADILRTPTPIYVDIPMTYNGGEGCFL